MATLLVVASVFVSGAETRLDAQDRFLAKDDIVLLGLGMRVEPEYQVVPKDIATIVGTFLSAATQPGNLAPFAPDAVVRAVLRGPGVPNGLDLTAAPNSPINIPPLSVPGIYTLEEIRFESGGQILMRGTPESVRIEVIEKLLVTQVTARALTAQEIRDKGIVFDKSNFQAYNFTAAFAVQDTPVQISFPIVLPNLQGAQDITLDQAGLGGINTIPTLPDLKTIIPDTLRLQAQIPNLKVVAFTLTVPDLKNRQLVVPPIPGVVVIPGDIGFLNQYFSVMLLVGNVAPQGSNLEVTDLTGEILLPAGNDTVVGSDDDPLRMAQTTRGTSPKVQLVVQPGADGKLGTADDIGVLRPGDSGSAEYLVEGRREGTHIIEFNIAGTLQGLPIGPVRVTGRAAGSVLVRNPAFTLTFTHPDTVAAGERYSLDVTVTNTSASPANFVSLNLFSQNVSGATVVGDGSRQIDSIPAGDSASVSFDLVSRITGKVTAATLDSDENVQGRFSLKSAVGELGVPVSPDSLILPSEANALPADVRSAVLGLLGKAWAVATAPAAALPKDVKRLSKQIVFDRAVQAAEAGMRISLHEPIPDSVAQLEMDFAGSDVGRLAALYPNVADRPFVQADFLAFDELRRRSIRGDALAAAVAAHLGPDLASLGAAAFHRSFAEKTSYRPAQLSVLLTAEGGTLPLSAVLVDSQGRRLGGQDAAGKVIKEIPYGDALSFRDGSGALVGQLLLLAAPDTGDYHVAFSAVAGSTGGPFTASLIVPDGLGGLRQVLYNGLRADTSATTAFVADAPYRVLLDLPIAGGAATPVVPAIDAPIVPPPPHLLGVVQQAGKDLLSCVAGISIEGAVDIAELSRPAGRVLGLLFNKEVTPQSVQDRLAATDITNFLVNGNKVVGVALQPGRRVAFVALRDPVGPFVARELTVTGVQDGRGRVMGSETLPIETTVDADASVVSGQVLGADGAPLPFANVRLLVSNPCGDLVGISAKSTDADGRFSWDWVPNSPRNRIAAVSGDATQSKAVDFTSQRNGQRLNINIVFVGRGTVTGHTLDENGAPLAKAVVKITSLTDDSSYGTVSDDAGYFAVPRVPVGNVLIEAVHLPSNARGSVAELLPLANAVVNRNVTLFSLTLPQTTVKFGDVTGYVLRSDGASPAADVPVVAYYQSGTQNGIKCPQGGGECAVGVTRTDSTGRFELTHISAGQLRFNTFDQLTFQQGDARITLPPDGSFDVRILLSKGLGTVNGIVLDASGNPVAAATVGGGLSLTTTDSGGHFTLVDVPVGQTELVAVSDTLGLRGAASIDIVQVGQVVNATIVLDAVGSVAGTVLRADGTTPVAGNTVYLFRYIDGGDAARIEVFASVKTDASGRYRFDRVPVQSPSGWVVSAFRSDFSDGNIKLVSLKFNGQVFRADILFRGGAGRVTGRVLAADGATPLRATVGLTGDQVAVAGGLVGTGFQSVSNYQIVDTDFTTGAFAFNKVFVGKFTVTAAGQFSPDPISIESTMPSPGATVQVELKLQDTSRIEGTVYRPDGVTAVGANVIVRYSSTAFRTVCATSGALNIGGVSIEAGSCGDVPQGIQDETVITDASGHYLVPLVNAGSFTLTATDPASGKTARTAGSVRPGQTGTFSLRLLGVSALSVVVRGSDTTTVIPNARITVTQLAFPKKSFAGAADATGALLLDGGDAFTEGDVVVTATDPRNGFAGRASGRVTTDGQTVTIRVFLYNASGTISGTVFQPDGITTVPFAEVVISNCVSDPGFIGVGLAPCLSGGPLAFAVADGVGAFSQDLIPLGGFRIDAFDNATARRGYAGGRIDFDRQVVPVNVIEAGRGLVTGTLYSSGSLAPLKNWEVRLTQLSPGGRPLPRMQTTSDVDGTFAFPGVVAGAFQLEAVKIPLLAGAPFGSAELSSRLDHDGQHVDIPMVVRVVAQQRGTVEGTVFNPDGTPASDVQVDLCAFANCSPGFDGGTGHLLTVTGADGRFAMPSVLIGRFTVTATAQASRNRAATEGELLFENDVAQVTLILVGTSGVNGTVVFGNGQPAPNVELQLSGVPSSGCPSITCTGFADGTGAFSFPNVPARTFYVRAVDPLSGLSGAATGTLAVGSPATVRIVLQATGRVTGRAVTSSGAPAVAITAELVAYGVDIFQSSDSSGNFVFPVVPPGAYTLKLEDPLGSGIAQRSVQVTGAVALGDIVLDDAAPRVASQIPDASSVGVPLATTVRIVFSEPISVGTISQANIQLAGPTGSVLGTLQTSDGDTTATFTPLAPLQQQTRYTLTVLNVVDRAGKSITPYSASFTTIDLTPPVVVDLSPAAGGNGVPLASVVRVKYSEPINPATYRGPPIVVTTAGVAVAGRTDFILGNTALVFTPTLPLSENTQYQVQVSPVSDLSGNPQPAGSSYAFSSFDRTPPQILGLTAAAGVIEGATTSVVANIGTAQDIAVVDFYLNGQPTLAARTSPFTLVFQATSLLGAPGESITISALATDTSGNRGTVPVSTTVLIVADAPPALVITSPAAGATFRTGDRVTVTAHVTDDRGATQVSYRALTGKPQDAGTQAIAPASTDATRTFAFSIGAEVVPGSALLINASAIDTKGQTSNAAAVSITILDATPPSVSITGTTTGATVAPGQRTSAVIAAQDLGGIASLTFTTGGVLAGSETRSVTPTQNSVATTFAFTVPLTARAGDTLTLDATATDAAGNTSSAARVLLPIADLNPPVLHLRTSTGATDIAPGSTITVVADGDDETGIATVALTGQGAFSVTQAKQVSPVSNSIQLPFDIVVPQGATEGAALNLSAVATDIFGNVSQPVTLVLTVRSGVTVTLPLSVLVAAGETSTIQVALASPAPAGGVIVDLQSADPVVAQVTPQLAFAAGDTVKQAVITGLSGGSATLSALVGGISKATMIATVRGGIVSGTVRNPLLQPVAGANVTVLSDNGVVFNTTSDASGFYLVEGVGIGGQFPTRAFSVRVTDPASQRIGAANGTLSEFRGFAHVDVVLVSAGTIGGTVTAANGTTTAGAGARVDLFASTNVSQVLASVFTDAAGLFEFPIVSPGTYVVEASDTSGNRGRSTALVISASGQHLDAPITYLGRGVVTGIVRDGSNNAVPNVPITFESTSLFGRAETIVTSAGSDGRFRFDGVFVGSFAVQARDPILNLSGTATGLVQSDAQVVTADIRLAQWANLQGTVFRADGTTPVVGATVTVFAGAVLLQTITDATGHYAFNALPLGAFTVTANEAATRGVGRVQGTLAVNGQTLTQNITFFAQGTLVATVLDASGAPAPFAAIRVSSSSAAIGDTFDVVTDQTGVLVIEHVLASQSVSVLARAGGLSGSIFTTLQANEIKPVTIRLEATASLAGTVLMPDGQTPANGVTVNCLGCGTIVTDATGTFQFTGLRLGTWTIEVRDTLGRKRAQARNLVLNQNAQVLTANMTLVGIGSLTGRVLNPDNSSAPNLAVDIRSLDPDFGGFAQVRTDAGGFYSLSGVVVGSIAVSTGDVARGLLGEASGTLARDGDTLNLDILLKNNAVTLPTTRSDGNLFPFDVQRNGSIAQGQGQVFAQPTYYGDPGGAMFLDLQSGATTTRFTGATIGTTESGGREIVVTQNNLAGLNVSRKVLVSSNYFSRYLEVLSNPTAAPITVDVRVQNNLRAPNIVSTSSGDAVLDVANPATPDQWVALNTSTDIDPFLQAFNSYGLPQVGYAFAGSGAANAPTVGAYVLKPSTQNGTLSYGWSNVTVQPGETVAFMHFGIQQYSRAALQASLSRLVQLPPESLEGLSPAEIAAIRNFAVPADGTSSLAALPAMGGTVTGRLLEADGTTPVPTANTSIGVRLRSGVVYFGRTYHTGTNGAATFAFNTTTLGSTFRFPVSTFTVEADHRVSAVMSPLVSGAFAPGSTAAVADVRFSNTGIVKGTVRRTSGAVVSGAQVVVSAAGVFSASYTPTLANGDYFAGGLAPRTYTVTALIPHPQNGAFKLTGTGAVTLAAGDVTTRDVTIQPTGAVTGVVRTAAGTVAVSTMVELRGIIPGDIFTSLTTFTDSSGTYRFTDAPLGTLTVRATDTVSRYTVSAPVTVLQDQTSSVNLALPGVGSALVTVTFTNGQPAAGASIEFQTPAIDTYFRTAGVTDASGRFTVTNVPAGPFALRAHRPGNYSISVDVDGTLTTNGQVVPLTAVLPPVGTVTAHVTNLNGTPAVGAAVQSNAYYGGQNFQFFGTTDANGDLLLGQITGPAPFAVRAYDPVTNVFRQVSGAITVEGQSLVVPITLNSVGQVTGHVTAPLGGPAVGITVYLTSESAFYANTTTTDGTGAYAFTDAPAGDFRVRSLGSTGEPFGSAEGTLVNGQVVVADFALNGVLLEATLADANGASYIVLSNGSTSGRFSDAFRGFPYLQLRRPSADSFLYFGGDAGATTDMSGAQLSIRNFDGAFAPKPLAGLTVTRKIYVDPSNYFARYLDVFDNPSAAPIAVDVQLSGAVNATEITASSSGDAVLSPSDNWFTTGDSSTPTKARGAVVVQGPGAALSLTTASTTVYASATYPSLQWSRLTVPAGGRAILMHFLGAGADDVAARAVAERLAQLPPESLTGLDPVDAARIVNFVVPADLSSPVPPFGTVTGRVLAGATPAPYSRVLVTGSAAVFSPSVTTTADANGTYRLRTLDQGSFTVQAQDPQTGELSPLVALSLAPGQTSVTQDLVIGNVGILRGTVRFAGGAPVSSGQVRIVGGVPAVDLTRAVAADGTFGVALKPGTYTVYGQAGFRNAVAASQVVVLGQETVTNLQLQAVANVRVILTHLGGAPFAGTPLYITVNGQTAYYPTYTDQNGIALFSFVSQGPFVITVAATGEQFSGVVLLANDGQTIDLPYVSSPGRVTGTVRLANQTPVTGGLVQIAASRFSSPIGSSVIAADGTYAIESIFAGTYVAIATVNGNTTATAPFSITPGQNAVVDIRFPGTTSVRVTVQSNAAPVAAAYVYVTDVVTNFRYAGTTDAAGQLLVSGVTEGPITVNVYSYGSPTLSMTKNATITATDIGQVVDVVFSAITGSVSGHVYVADGVTPASSVSVQLVEPVSNTPIATTYTDGAGAYTFASVGLEGGDFRVEAHSPVDFDVTVSASGSLASTPNAVIDLILPVGAVTGHVFLADGVTPAADVDLRVAQSTSGGDIATIYAYTDAAGSFSAAGVTAGAFEVLVKDRTLTGRAAGTVASVATSPVANVQLPAFGTVSGVVLDALGAPAPFADLVMSVTSLDAGYSYGRTGADGSFTFARVPRGGFSIQACRYDASSGYVCTGGRGELTTGGQTVNTTLTMPGSGSVAGQAFAADGATPLSGATVYAVGGAEGYNGTYFEYASTDGTGHFAFTNVPAGPFYIEMVDQYNRISGVVDGVMVAGTPQTLNVQAGSAVDSCYMPLSGADGFLFDVDCWSGAVQSGGTVDGALTDAFRSDGYTLRMNGQVASAQRPATSQLSGRGLDLGLRNFGGLTTHRKVFVPVNGGFMRFLDTVTNTTAAPVNLTVQVSSTVGGANALVVDPATTSNTYAVTLAAPTLSGGVPSVVRPALAHVFGGPQAAVTVSSVRFPRFIGPASYEWRVTIPAGQSMTFMHFGVQKAPTDVAGAQAQAAALANLSDPDALTGMSPDERASVVNFKIP